MLQRRLVSIIVPCYNEAEVFPLLQQALVKLADQLAGEYAVELIFVDDGSRDTTWDLIRAFAAADARVRGLALSRNFGHQAALTCGYDLAQGDAVICIDADLQDPPQAIAEMLQRWREGYDVVQAVRKSREGETWFKLWTASLFYKLIRVLGAKHVRENAGDFRLMSRRAIEAFRRLREHHRFVRGMVGWLGFRETEITYERKARAAGTTKYPFFKMLLFAMDAVVSFSAVPLRLAYLCAALFSLVFLGYLGYAVAMYLFCDRQMVPGWTSLILAVTGFGAANLFCLGLLGEYIGRTYAQVKERPLYLVMEDTRSIVAQASQAPPAPSPQQGADS